MSAGHLYHSLMATRASDNDYDDTATDDLKELAFLHDYVIASVFLKTVVVQ